MIQYREILRLHSQPMSQRGIAASCGYSRQMVKEVIERAQKKGISLPLSDEMTDCWLQEVLLYIARKNFILMKFNFSH